MYYNKLYTSLVRTRRTNPDNVENCMFPKGGRNPNKKEFDELLRKMANLSKEGEAEEKEKKNPQK